MFDKTLFTTLMLVCALGCSSSADGTNAPSGGGTVKKAGACTKDADCAEKNAKCSAAIGNFCTGSLGGDAFETECSAATVDQCAGLICITFKANVQNKTGVCSLKCSDDASCGPGGACVELGVGSKVCLSTCSTNADCSNGFVCVEDPSAPGSGRKGCFVSAS